jgi:hypothetical protein
MFIVLQEEKKNFYVVVFRNHEAITNGHFTTSAQSIPVICKASEINADF